jgi:4-hydroxy-tetrahydrodipicolinate synthase
MLKGSLVAIATPMQPGGELDLPGLHKLIDFHIANGTAGIVIVGTTGESPTVDFEEHCLLIKTAVDSAKGRIPIVAGTGSNSTAEAIEQTEYAKKAGASYCLSVVPYYNKPSQEGLYLHFKTIAEKVELPLIVYNVPGRTMADLGTDTVLRLAELPGVVGIKDATSDLVRHVELMRRLPKAKSFTLLSGNDDTALAYMLLGGHGVISVTANVAPRAMAKMCDAALSGRLEEARSANATLMSLHTKLFVEANPIPVKWAMAEMGLIGGTLRLPLTPLAASHHDIVRAALREAGCL